MTALGTHNIGTADRAVRIALGLGLISIAFVGPETNWGLVGLVPLATAALGSCPPCSIFGLSTCPTGT